MADEIEKKENDANSNSEEKEALKGNLGQGAYKFEPETSTEDNDTIFNDIIDRNMSDKKYLKISKSVDDPYFQDDELFLGDDEKILNEDTAGAVAQLDNVVTWEIEKIMKEGGDLKSKYALRADPPIFRIKSSDGTVGEFVLTRELSKEFHEAFKLIDKAYDGIDARKEKEKKENRDLNEKFNDFLKNITENPGRSAVIVIFILLILYTVIF